MYDQHIISSTQDALFSTEKKLIKKNFTNTGPTFQHIISSTQGAVTKAHSGSENWVCSDFRMKQRRLRVFEE